jgi:hypothetical protein
VASWILYAWRPKHLALGNVWCLAWGTRWILAYLRFRDATRVSWAFLH